jgi:hypothetical protein
MADAPKKGGRGAAGAAAASGPPPPAAAAAAVATAYPLLVQLVDLLAEVAALQPLEDALVTRVCSVALC